MELNRSMQPELVRVRATDEKPEMLLNCYAEYDNKSYPMLLVDLVCPCTGLVLRERAATKLFVSLQDFVYALDDIRDKCHYLVG